GDARAQVATARARGVREQGKPGADEHDAGRTGYVFDPRVGAVRKLYGPVDAVERREELERAELGHSVRHRERLQHLTLDRGRVQRGSARVDAQRTLTLKRDLQIARAIQWPVDHDAQRPQGVGESGIRGEKGDPGEVARSALKGDAVDEIRVAV